MIAAASPQLGRRSQRLQHVPRPVYVGQSYRGGAELRHRRPWAAAAFVPPTSANPAAAVFNFCTLAQRDLRFPGFVYLASSVDMSSASSGLDDARALVAMAFASSVSLVATEDMGNVPLPKTYKQALNCEHSEYWIEAINKELTGLLRLRSWDYVPVELLPPGSNIMHCHFIFTVKRIRSGAVEKFKARLVADGNTQKYLVDFDRVFSAVVKPATIRLLLIIAAALDLDLCQVDIKQAYLQSELKEDLYMRVPPGLSPYDADGRPVCCKLRRALYGCKQSGKLWADEFAKFLVDYGFTRSTIDTCLFTLRSSDGFIILCAIYVDDAAIAHNSGKTYQAFLKSLSKRFPVDDRGTLQWLLGVSITRDRGKRSISLSQDLYVADLLKRYAPYIAAGHTRGYDSPMEEGIILNRDDAPEIGSSEWEAMADKRADYMAIVGSLLWLSTMTYPQLAYATSQLGRFVNNPGESHLNAATRVLIYLSGVRSHTIEICPQMDRPLEVYVDSSWQSQFSSSGALFFLYGCLFAWFSKTQRSVSLSSAEAEFFGAMLAAKDAVFYRELLHDLLTAAGLEVQAAPTVIWSDSKSAVDLAFDPVAFKNTKHILRAAYFLRDLVLKRAVILNHLKGTHMLADLLTKAQSRPVFLELMRRLRANDTRPIASPSGRQDDSPPPPSPPPSPSDGTLHTSDAPPAASAQTPRRRRPPPIQRKSAAAIFCANCDQRLHRVQFGYVWDRCTVCRVPLCLDTRLCVETSSYLQACLCPNRGDGNHVSIEGTYNYVPPPPRTPVDPSVDGPSSFFPSSPPQSPPQSPSPAVMDRLVAAGPTAAMEPSVWRRLTAAAWCCVPELRSIDIPSPPPSPSPSQPPPAPAPEEPVFELNPADFVRASEDAVAVWNRVQNCDVALKRAAEKAEWDARWKDVIGPARVVHHDHLAAGLPVSACPCARCSLSRDWAILGAAGSPPRPPPSPPLSPPSGYAPLSTDDDVTTSTPGPAPAVATAPPGDFSLAAAAPSSAPAPTTAATAAPAHQPAATACRSAPASSVAAASRSTPVAPAAGVPVASVASASPPMRCPPVGSSGRRGPHRPGHARRARFVVPPPTVCLRCERPDHRQRPDRRQRPCHAPAPASMERDVCCCIVSCRCTTNEVGPSRCECTSQSFWCRMLGYALRCGLNTY